MKNHKMNSNKRENGKRVIRILPMTDDPAENPAFKSLGEVRDWLLSECRSIRKGVFELKSKNSIGDAGSIVIFKYKKQLIAEAIVMADVLEIYNPRLDEEIYTIRFIPSSIRLFAKPIPISDLDFTIHHQPQTIISYDDYLTILGELTEYGFIP